MSIKSKYTQLESRDYYKGHSFQFTELQGHTHYRCDNYVTDFVSYGNVLLVCIKDHISPSVIDSDYLCIERRYDGNITVVSEYWNLVLDGGDFSVIIEQLRNKIDKIENPDDYKIIIADSTKNIIQSELDVNDVISCIHEVADIKRVIPNAASASNQLADRSFVNSSIQTATATFRGNYENFTAVLEAGPSEADNNDYLVVRHLEDYAPKWNPDDPGSYYVNTIVSYDEIDPQYHDLLHRLYKCIEYVDYDDGDPKINPLEDTEHWQLVTSNPKYEGTWRFKYVPYTTTYDPYNWEPEYQINEGPFTSDEWAAIDSGITSQLVEDIRTAYQKPTDGIPASDFTSDVRNDIAKGVSAKGTLDDLVPAQATVNNKLADKNFVNSSIQTATATFRGNYNTWGDVPDDSASDTDWHTTEADKNDYLVVRSSDGYAPLWDSGQQYYVGDIVSEYDELMGEIHLYRRINNEETFERPSQDPEHWEEVTSNPKYEGTWRFKYVPKGGTYSKMNWVPEYQVNEKPLTAEQLAAINSGITAAKVTKLDGVEAGAKDNVFWATYGTTTYAQVQAAVDAGKVIGMKRTNDSLIYFLVNTRFDYVDKFLFTARKSQIDFGWASLDTSDAWLQGTLPLEVSSLKASAITNQNKTSTDYYTSVKAVVDYVDAAIFGAMEASY